MGNVRGLGRRQNKQQKRPQLNRIDDGRGLGGGPGWG